MKATIIASLVASAAAFAPAGTPAAGATTSSLAAAKDEMTIDYKGQPFKFDPLKISETYEPLLPWFKEAELRHGRTAMLAVVGFIAQDFVRIPGDAYSFASLPKNVDAHEALVAGPLAQLMMWIGLWDLIVTGPACVDLMKGEREPGDYAWTMFAPKDPAKLQRKKDSELLNGRLAMIAVGGIATQSVINDTGFPFV